MNRLFTFLCIVSLLLFHTSCNEGVMELESSDVELKTRTTEQKVHNLIQQARYGDADAYNSLALCYRDGDGVDKSYLTYERNAKASDYKPQRASGKRGKPVVNTAVFHSAAQYTAKAAKFFEIAYLPLEEFPKARGARGVILPPVIFDSEMPKVRCQLEEAKRLGATDCLVGNLGHIELAREFGLKLHGDLRLNITNNETTAALESLGFEDVILSPELTLPRIRDISGCTSVVVYGRLPLMVTEKCVGKEIGGCSVCERGQAKLVDRMGISFPVLKIADHRSLIVNSLPTYILDRPRDLTEGFITRRHYIFTVESPREVDAILSCAQTGSPIPGGKCRRLPQNQPPKKGK